jgi:hypothetical protein
MAKRRSPSAKPKLGRPAIFGERLPLGLRVTKDLKKKLGDAANASGRSLSQEAELRLEHTFNTTNVLFDALDLAYGRHWTGLLLALAQVVQITGTRALAVSQWEFDGCEDWIVDPYAYDQVVAAINVVLEAFRPHGAVPDSPPPNWNRLPASAFLKLGEGFALDLLRNLASPDEKRPDAEIARAIAQRLADIAPVVRREPHRAPVTPKSRRAE